MLFAVVYVVFCVTMLILQCLFCAADVTLLRLCLLRVVCC